MISRLRATSSKSYFEVLLISRKKTFFVMGAEKGRFLDMEPIWVILEKTCFCALNKGGFDGFKMVAKYFSFFKLNYKQKPCERTLLVLLGTKYGCSAPF